MRVEKSLVGSAPNELPVRETTRFGYKRVGHGGVAWTAAANADALHQPQDGAQENGTLYTAMSRLALREPEDARLTGGTRSLMRRVMGLNVTALSPQRVNSLGTPIAAGARKTQPRPVAKSQAQVA